MQVALLICLVLVVGMSLGWALHHRSVRHMTPILRRLAAETNGVVNSQVPFVMPKLLFSYSGVDVEVSSASTGLDGESIRYTYVLFKGLVPRDFEFRVLPRSLQTVAEEWAGYKKSTAPELGKLKKHLAIYTSDNRLTEAVISEPIQTDLLFWADRKRGNRISDIRTFDDKLIYAVTGALNSYEESKLLLGSAFRFFDAFNNIMSNTPRRANSI